MRKFFENKFQDTSFAWLESAGLLGSAEKGELFDAAAEYILYGDEPSLMTNARLVWPGLHEFIDSCIGDFEYAEKTIDGMYEERKKLLKELIEAKHKGGEPECRTEY